MNGTRLVSGGILGVLLATGLVWHTAGLAGQALPRPLPDIQSLTEAGEGLAIRQKAADSGVASFASTDGSGVLLAMPATAPAEARARSFMATYGVSFGVKDNAALAFQRATPPDRVGVEHVRFRQLHLGVPVSTGELVVHLRGARVTAVNGHIVTDLPATVAATVPPAAALQAAADVVAKMSVASRGTDATYSEPTLEVFDKSVFEATFIRPRAAWFVEARGAALREFIWVDAETGAVLHHYSQLTDARVRSVYTAGNTTTLPGTLVRSEGSAPTGDADADNAYDFAGVTYDYYLSEHGRDSYDGAGAALRSTVHYCPSPCLSDYQNAFWNGVQMVYGAGFSSADDVVAHELTHALTERTAGLIYSLQSGALNESFSDIFGETVDLIDGRGNDSPGVRWLAGEDLSVGAVRNLYNPGQFGHPGKVSDSNYVCSSQDNGGVHSNSGVPNHAFALMTDGGSYNGRSINGIGLSKSGRIQYRALTTYLTSGASFLDDYNAINQSCSDLVGSDITASDCAQVKLAMEAVELDRPAPCGVTIPAPPLCPIGTAPSRTVFADDFENPTSGRWSSASTSVVGWIYGTGRAKSGTYAMLGADPPFTSDHSAAMTAGVVIPPNARLYFDSAFEFESSAPFDGGVLEYSLDGGTTWVDGGSLIEAGQAYNNTMITGTGNPLGGRRGFTLSSLGFTGTRVNLTSLSGQTVRFRFRIGTDVSVSASGWSVDNVSVYQCETASGPGPFGKVAPSDGSMVWPTQLIPLSWQASTGATSYEYCVDTTNDGDCSGRWTTTTATSVSIDPLSGGTPYYWQVRAVNAQGTAFADGGTWWTFSVGLPPRRNVAAAVNGGTATASTEHSAGYAAGGAINGDRAGRNWGNGGGWNDATPGVWPDYLEVDFDGLQLINEIDLFSVQDNYQSPTSPTPGQTFSLYGLTDFEVQYWSGTAWVPIPGGVISGNNQVWRQLTFSPMFTRRIRIWITGALNTWSRIAEVEAYSYGPLQAPAAFTKLSPGDRSTGQPIAPITLAWQASADAAQYEYCIDTTDDGACTTSWVPTTQLTAALEPLSGNRMYYWQVRALNDAGATLADGGTWWRFTTAVPTRVNVAAAANGGAAIASSVHSLGYRADGAINGDRAGLDWGNGGGWNDATPGEWPDYLQVAFSAPQLIDEIDVFSVQDNYQAPISPSLGQTFSRYGLTDFLVQAWSGTEWVTVPGGAISGNDQVWRQLTFAPVLTTGIRIFVTGALTTWTRLAEVEAYSVGSGQAPSTFAKLSPTDGSTGQSPAPATFTWQPSAGATRYELCFDTTDDGVCDAGSWIPTTNTSMTLGPLSSAVSYYWQVRAVNAEGTTPADSGVWWNFVTGAPARVNVASAANGGAALASSEHSAGYAADGAINGDRAGLNWGNGGGWNDATPGIWPDYLQVAFAAPQVISEIDVFSVQDNYQAPSSPTRDERFSLYGLTDFEVQTWSGTEWVTVPGGVISGNDLVWRQLTFPPMLTTGIRIFVNGALTTWSRIAEVEAYSVGGVAGSR